MPFNAELFSRTFLDRFCKCVIYSAIVISSFPNGSSLSFYRFQTLTIINNIIIIQIIK